MKEKSSASELVVCAILLGAPACTSEHGLASIGTETGNAPLPLDASRVALLSPNGELVVSGSIGAVSIPSAEVEVVGTLTGDVFQGTSRSDGSFAIAVGSRSTDMFKVSAKDRGVSSERVLVALGGSAATAAGATSLSCPQRTSFAGSQMNSVAASADRSCTSAADCMLVDTSTDCSESKNAWPHPAAAFRHALGGASQPRRCAFSSASAVSSERTGRVPCRAQATKTARRTQGAPTAAGAASVEPSRQHGSPAPQGPRTSEPADYGPTPGMGDWAQAPVLATVAT
jgi:hypothetical protein